MKFDPTKPMLYGIPVRVNDPLFQEAVNTPYDRTWKERLFEGLFTKNWRPRKKIGYRTTWVPSGEVIHSKVPGEPECLFMHSETLARIVAALEAEEKKRG